MARSNAALGLVLLAFLGCSQSDGDASHPNGPQVEGGTSGSDVDEGGAAGNGADGSWDPDANEWSVSPELEEVPAYDFCTDESVARFEYDVSGDLSLAQALQADLARLSPLKRLALVLENGTELAETDLQTIATINKPSNEGGAGLSQLTSLGLCNLETLRSEAFRGLGDDWLEYLYMDSLEEVEPFAFAGEHLVSTTSLRGISMNSVVTIGEGAFQWASLESLMLPNVETIEKDAFRDNYRMLEVYLPRVKTLADAVFDDNTHLLKATFPELTMVGRNVFDDNHELVEINMPKVTYLGKSFFGSCWALESVHFPSVEKVDDNAFDNCQNLKNVSLPNAMDVRNRVFSECVSLREVSLPKVTNFMNDVFSICSGEGGPIPNTCCQLERIYLPAVESIGSNTFGGCTALSSVVLGQVPPTVNTDAFVDTASDLVVYHSGNAADWAGFAATGNESVEVVDCSTVSADVCAP